MEKDLNKIKTVAISAAKKAGKYLLKEFDVFDRSGIKMKSRYEILTKCDLGSERIIRNEINKTFKDHNILGEEIGDDNKTSEYTWIIDPIDGTTNFSIHNPLWSISIGVAKSGVLVFGLVYIPYQQELFFAIKNQGAWRNDKKIKVSNLRGETAMHTFCHGGSKESIKLALAYYEKQKISKFDCRQLGSAAIELAYVACGRVESIMIPGSKIWDIAAGVLLVKEAGGQITSLNGAPWEMSMNEILASNGLVHQDILKTIKSL